MSSPPIPVPFFPFNPPLKEPAEIEIGKERGQICVPLFSLYCCWTPFPPPNIPSPHCRSFILSRKRRLCCVFVCVCCVCLFHEPHTPLKIQLSSRLPRFGDTLLDAASPFHSFTKTQHHNSKHINPSQQAIQELRPRFSVGNCATISTVSLKSNLPSYIGVKEIRTTL